MAFDQTLRQLAEPGIVRINSSQSLVDEVATAARKYKLTKNPRVIPVDLPSPFYTTPVEVLRQVGVATTFYGSSPFATVARHWAQLRYCATLTKNRHGNISLSPLGNEVVHHHKVAQSEYLGIGFALVVAQEALRLQHPGWEFSPVDADYALARGIPDVGTVTQAAGMKSRPDYFLLGRRINGGGGLKVVVLECKGTHNPRKGALLDQLSKACNQVRSVEIEGRTLQSLMVASRFHPSGVTSHIIDPPGEIELWPDPEDNLDEILSQDLESAPEPFIIRKPTAEHATAEAYGEDLEEQLNVNTTGEHEDAEDEAEVTQIVSIPEASRRWFSRVLVRTLAASVLAFAGDSETAAKYHVPRRYEDGNGQYGIPLENDIEINASTSFSLPGNRSAQGAQYSMPLPDGRRLDVFRGIEKGAYEELGNERVASYFRRAQRLWSEWNQNGSTTTRDGDPIAVGRDGTVVTLRISGRAGRRSR
ncbi:hypothetical protein E1161_18850 [Saccharopolyspora aridisoli]|uniref:Uncharacterized protein n=1 Tax=Saccharopolyspora aridisoli TaxID=2530385 RepID=A0A4R4UJP1_9PSEU|nr:hypothetical protein [Saccharopolyspora aridisoli]TDC90376.1 hypothetical protein E1161_18850 [Saccharopolyspora aridisoli]